MVFKEALAGYVIAIATQVINIIYNLLLPAKLPNTPTTVDPIKEIGTEN